MILLMIRLCAADTETNRVRSCLDSICDRVFFMAICMKTLWYCSNALDGICYGGRDRRAIGVGISWDGISRVFYGDYNSFCC